MIDMLTLLRFVVVYSRENAQTAVPGGKVTKIAASEERPGVRPNPARYMSIRPCVVPPNGLFFNVRWTPEFYTKLRKLLI